jgi:hypothetical protein
VWLLSSHDIPNLKVEGSSPSFGYSYSKLLTVFFVFFCTMSLWWERCARG